MKNLINKVIDFNLLEQVNDFDYLFNFYYQRLSYYKKELELLRRKKPFSFQKKKLREYEILEKEILDNINDCQRKVDKEYSSLEKILSNKKIDPNITQENL